MKVLQFTIPVHHDKTVVTRLDNLPHFYPYLHRHKEMQLTWVQHGEGTLVVDHSMHDFKMGDIFLIGGGQPHLFKSPAAYFEQDSTKRIRTLDVFFDPEVVCRTVLAVPELKYLQHFIDKAQSGIQVSGNVVWEVARIMESLFKTQDGAEVIRLFIKLMQRLAGTEDHKVLSTALSSDRVNTETEGIRISHIYSYILENYDKSIALEDVASQAFMTPQAFCRFFKKHTRRTFVQFLNEVRIAEARKQFASGAYESISSIAYNTGFNSITNFNRVFRSVVGQAPTEYIESLREVQRRVEVMV